MALQSEPEQKTRKQDELPVIFQSCGKLQSLELQNTFHHVVLNILITDMYGGVRRSVKISATASFLTRNTNRFHLYNKNAMYTKCWREQKQWHTFFWFVGTHWVDVAH
jgi:hypothetical protein